MGLAARIGDQTNHGGVVVGAGIPTVTIEGIIAAVADPALEGGAHSCPINPIPSPPHAMTPFTNGSSTVSIGGQPALRVGDTAACGAAIAKGAPSVMIGG